MNNVLRGKKIAFLGFDNLTISVAEYFTKNGFNDFDILSDQSKPKPFELKKFISITKIVPNYDYYIATDYFFKHKNYYYIFTTEPDLKNRLILQEALLSMIFDNTKIIAIIGNDVKYIFYHFLNAFFSKRSNYQLLSNFSMRDIRVNLNDKKKIIFLNICRDKIDFIRLIQINYLFLLNDECINISEMEEYVLKKQNINCTTIFNVDNAKIKKTFDNYNANIGGIGVKKIPLSVKKILNGGYSLIDNTFYNYFDDNNSHYDLMIDKEFIMTYDMNISILSCLFLVLDIFKNINETLNSIEWHKFVIKNYFQSIGYKYNITFISNLVDVNFKKIREQLNFFSKIYYICIVNNNCEILFEETMKDDHSFFLIIDERSIVEQTKLNIKNYKIFNKIENCYQVLKNQINEMINSGNIAIILTTTDVIAHDKVDFIFANYIKQFTNFILEID